MLDVNGLLDANSYCKWMQPGVIDRNLSQTFVHQEPLDCCCDLTIGTLGHSITVTGNEGETR